MTAGYETLKALDEAAYEQMNDKVNRLVEGYREAADKHHIPLQINRAGSMVGFFFADEPVVDYETAQRSNLKQFATYYRGMIAEGILLPPSQFEGLFVSTAHTDEDIEQTIRAVHKVFANLND